MSRKSPDRRIIIDLETKKTFQEVGGRDHLDLLGVTVCGVYRYDTDEYLTFEEKELGQLQNLMIDSGLIVGFNHVGFDLPVLQPYFSVDVKNFPVFDLMLDCEKKLGHRLGLDTLAKATLGIGKTGHGLDAIRFYKEGKIKELKEYCLNDVKVTKELFDYGIQNGKVAYFSKIGNQKKDLSVDWKRYKKMIEPETVIPAQYKLF